MNWKNLGLQLTLQLLPLIVLALTMLISYGVALLKKQITKIDSETARASFNAALVAAEGAAKDAVMAIQQKLVASLKAAAADGKLTEQEKKQALDMAVQYFREHMSVDALRVLEAAWGPWQSWLEDFIEAKVGENKTVREIAAMARPLS